MLLGPKIKELMLVLPYVRGPNIRELSTRKDAFQSGIERHDNSPQLRQHRREERKIDWR